MVTTVVENSKKNCVLVLRHTSIMLLLMPVLLKLSKMHTQAYHLMYSEVQVM